MRYPDFLKDHGTIGFVAPSFGCAIEPYHTCFDSALHKLHDRGFATELLRRKRHRNQQYSTEVCRRTDGVLREEE